jgi:hypothetical protein
MKKKTKGQLLRQLETIQYKVMALWQDLGPDNATYCQTATRVLADLQRAIERGEIKPR